MMAVPRTSEWAQLFDLAVEILAQFKITNGFTPSWSFGGGTSLMLQIDHRESHDIDIFVEDPQVLPFLNPETQGYRTLRMPDSYLTDGTMALKLAYQGAGEIDFICCQHILEVPVEWQDVRGNVVALETPAEIVAKKVYFRGASFQPRDMFDLAAVVEHFGADYVVAAIRACGTDRCATAHATVAKASPRFVQSIIGQLMYRERTAHLIERARDISLEMLEQAMAGA
ncbi:nucleotidyl transferase AbiEii/AbiGii toxin family protein [Novosphingobium colocasiae]|uniref:nucleotidyl transferase AbiEii/AbiGii toxin family protein n=1 Tax=Novosphingobium colocasiae TaxID=1256513 RepID=UPI0035B3D259